uniref:C2H2-type domain-containing protein n=1 Tax=Romanomermis culicivorax TaxID=13658 RepID=A0A915K7W0_ROMCU
MPAVPSDISATATQTTDFLKLTLNEISSIALAWMDESTGMDGRIYSHSTCRDGFRNDYDHRSNADEHPRREHGRSVDVDGHCSRQTRN